MSLFDLVKEHNGVRLSAHSLRQLTTLVVTHVARRRTNQTRHAVLLLILTHIDTRHHRLVVEEIVCQCLGKLRLTYTRGTEEDKRGDRSLRILKACTRTAHGI